MIDEAVSIYCLAIKEMVQIEKQSQFKTAVMKTTDITAEFSELLLCHIRCWLSE